MPRPIETDRTITLFRSELHQGMAFGAELLTGVGMDRSPTIGRSVNNFEVIRVHAPLVLAEVVDRQPVRDGSYELLPNESVGVHVPGAIEELPVASTIDRSEP